MALYRHIDEILREAERRGLLTEAAEEDRTKVLIQWGLANLSTAQLEAAKRCFQRVLQPPGPVMAYLVNAQLGMARYHRERKEWTHIIQYSEHSPHIPGTRRRGQEAYAAHGTPTFLVACGRRRSSR